MNISIINNRLVGDAPGGGLIALAAPDKEGKWAMRASPDTMQIRFEPKDARATGLTLIQDGLTREFDRIDESP